MALARSPEPSGDKLRVLVVEDDRTSQVVLASILRSEGFDVVTADDGRRGIDVFVHEQPDLVLMDIEMPEMDGYEATAAIKGMCGDRFVPVIFLTATANEKRLARCVEVGGDDFMTKPYSRVMLRAKIDALMRIRELYSTVASQNDELRQHQMRIDREQRVAEKVFSTMLRPSASIRECLRTRLQPMGGFNGDLLLAARTPSGSLHVLLGDFTGHGLSAAIGSVPMSDVFYDMTSRGYAMRDILVEINRKLRTVLPTGMFCAATYVVLDPNQHSVAVWCGGNPELLVRGLDGTIRRRVVSSHLPLGILDSPDMDLSMEEIPVQKDERIYLYTDGVVEATDGGGEMFGQHRVDRALCTGAIDVDPFDQLIEAIDRYRDGLAQSDDITLVEIRNVGPVVEDESESGPGSLRREPMTWRTAVRLDADALRRVDPLPLLIQSLIEIQGLQEHRENLYTVLAELFFNALDHGLLKLDSALKASPSGFRTYYEERRRRLDELEEGWIEIRLAHERFDDSGRLAVTVADSGTGFDPSRSGIALDENVGYSGRGIALIRTLCESVSYNQSGTEAHVTYCWR